MAVFSEYKDVMQLDYGDAALTIQEFVNHGGTIYKVYVLGDDKHIVKRVSLRCRVCPPQSKKYHSRSQAHCQGGIPRVPCLLHPDHRNVALDPRP
jgi:hypothetical protein